MTEEEEDSEAIKTELREAFRLYDKEGANNGNTYYGYIYLPIYYILYILHIIWMAFWREDTIHL